MAFINRIKNDFTIIPNGIFGACSANEIAVLAYLASRPEGWKFNSSDIAAKVQRSRDNIQDILKSLEAKGYLERHKNADGSVTYILHYPPDLSSNVVKSHIGDLPKNEKACVVKSLCGDLPPVINTDLRNKTIPPEIMGVCDRFFQEKISIDNARYKNQLLKVKIESWYDAIQKLNAIDGEPLKVIAEVLTWSLTDEFWNKNIVSLAGLRQKSKNGLSKYFNLKNAWERSKPKAKSSDSSFEVCPIATNAKPIKPYWETEVVHEN